MKKESGKRHLSPEEIEAIRRQRANDPEKNAHRKALLLYPSIVALGDENSNPNNVLEKVLAYHIEHGSPIPLVGFWGVGEKEGIDLFDKSYINSLAKMEQEIKNHYNPGARITIILADLHGRFNGYKEENISKYLSEVAKNLRNAEISPAYLSSLYDQASLVLPNVDKSINMARLELNEAYWVYGKHKKALYTSAALHHNSSLDPNRAAYYYVVMRLNERKMLSDSFPHSILLVNGTKQTSEPLLPKDMPILYLREGPVWFRKETK